MSLGECPQCCEHLCHATFLTPLTVSTRNPLLVGPSLAPGARVPADDVLVLIVVVVCFVCQANYEYAWVKEDFFADKIANLPSTPIGSYLPVCIGQKVEIIEGKLASLPELCLARLPNSQQEGLIPINILRYPLKTSIMSLKSSLDSEGKQFICLPLVRPFPIAPHSYPMCNVAACVHVLVYRPNTEADCGLCQM